MIQLTRLRELTLLAPSRPGRHSFLSAASGLVKVGAHFYVVADDEYHLGVFPSAGDDPGRLVRVFEGTLPLDVDKRKKHKPDFEALALLPAFSGYSAGALLCIPSGSKPNRQVGALFAVDASGGAIGIAHAVDMSVIYARLRNDFPPNIEGATVLGDELLLMQRGNQRRSRNACIRFDLRAVLRALNQDGPLDVAPTDVALMDLGDIDGVPLCFSDVAALPGVGIAFTAIAEDTDDSYVDGPFAGAAVGILDADGRMRYLERLAGAPKVEGIHAEIAGQWVRLWLVTDADDADTPASLLTAEICID